MTDMVTDMKEIDQLFDGETKTQDVEFDNYVDLKGGVLSIQFHDEGVDSAMVCRVFQGIADTIQRRRIWAEDTIQDMQTRAKDRVDDGETEVDHPDEVVGLRQKQYEFMERLEDELDLLSYLHQDLVAFFNANNDNDDYKLLWQTDTERRKAMNEAKAKRAIADNEKAKELREAQAKIREQRRAAREARYAA